MTMRGSSPAATADTIRRRHRHVQDKFAVYWMAVDGDRAQFARELDQRLNELPLATIILRSGGFDNPNAVMQDVVNVLTENRDSCEPRMRGASAAPEPPGLVLLARSDFAIGQCSSPVNLPDWVPGQRGGVSHCTIQDLSWSVEVGLDAVEIGVGDLARQLYELERALYRRLEQTYGRRPDLTQLLCRVIGRPHDVSLLGVLAQARSTIEDVRQPASFRPEARSGKSITGRLWSSATDAQNGMLNTTRALEQAFDLDADIFLDAICHRSLGSVLRRSSRDAAARGHAINRSTEFASDTLVAIVDAAQLITCAHHAGEYGTYPVDLLRLWIADLRRSLLSAEALLNAATQSQEAALAR